MEFYFFKILLQQASGIHDIGQAYYTSFPMIERDKVLTDIHGLFRLRSGAAGGGAAARAAGCNSYC